MLTSVLAAVPASSLRSEFSVELTLSRRFRLLLSSDRRLLVMLSLPDFLLDSGLRAVSLKSA